MNKFLLLAFVVAASLLRSADANASTVVCDGTCAEDLRIPCDTLITEYDIQGSCCIFTKITAYDGCRVEVQGGNCYWFPKCEECPGRDEGRWQSIKCGLEQQSETGICPAASSDGYPTNWKNNPPTPEFSCSPTMAPALPTQPPDSASSSKSVRVMALLGTVAALAQM